MRVCFSLSSDALRNSRALRQIGALADSGILVSLFHAGEGLRGPLKHPNIAVFPVPPPESPHGPAHFVQLHRNLASALRSAKPACDVFHASDLYALPASAHFAKASNRPYSFDSRELYAHVVGTAGRPWAKWTWHLLQKKLLPRARFIFTVSDGIADHLAQTYRIARPIVVPNVPDSSSSPSESDIRSTLQLPKSTFLAVYAGSVRPNRGCQTALRAVASAPQLHLAFVGNGPMKSALIDEARHLGCSDRIHFIPPVEPSTVSAFLSTADVGLSLLPDSCLNHQLALPNKLFEYVAGGVPVVASNLPEMARLIADHGVGSCVEPSSVAALRTELLALASDRPRLNALSMNCRLAADLLRWQSYKPLFVNAFLELETL